MDGIFNAANLLSLACIAGLVLVLGGGVVFMLYGWRELVAGGRRWLDRK